MTAWLGAQLQKPVVCQMRLSALFLESFHRLPHRFDETLSTMLGIIGAGDCIVEHSGSDLDATQSHES